MRPRAVRAGATQSNGNQSNVACWFQQLQGVGPGCASLKVTGASPCASLASSSQSRRAAELLPLWVLGLLRSGVVWRVWRVWARQFVSLSLSVKSCLGCLCLAAACPAASLFLFAQA